VLSVLKKPYPCNKDLKDNLVVASIVCVFLFFFLYLFEPFDTLITYSPEVVFGYTVITFVVCFSIAVILPKFFPNYFCDRNWTVGKEILHMSFIVFTIGVVNFFYAANNLIGREGEEVYSFYNFFLSISITFLIGVMPIIIVVLINQTRLLKRYKEESEKINQSKHSTRNSDKDIVFKGEGKNEEFTILDKNILFIKSDSNYCEIHVNDNSDYKKQLLRGSLNSLEENLKELDSFIRVHRSYIVNFNNIDKVSGTAQGYKLHFQNVEQAVPVSRNKSAQFKSLVS